MLATEHQLTCSMVFWLCPVGTYCLKPAGGGSLFVMAGCQFFSGPPFAYAKIFWSPLCLWGEILAPLGLGFVKKILVPPHRIWTSSFTQNNGGSTQIEEGAKNFRKKFGSPLCPSKYSGPHPQWKNSSPFDHHKRILVPLQKEPPPHTKQNGDSTQIEKARLQSGTIWKNGSPLLKWSHFFLNNHVWEKKRCLWPRWYHFRCTFSYPSWVFVFMASVNYNRMPWLYSELYHISWPLLRALMGNNTMNAL